MLQRDTLAMTQCTCLLKNLLQLASVLLALLDNAWRLLFLCLCLELPPSLPKTACPKSLPVAPLSVLPYYIVSGLSRSGWGRKVSPLIQDGYRRL